MKVPSGLDRLLDLVYVLNGVSGRMTEGSLTATTKEVRKHIERISGVSLTTFVNLQAFLCKIINTRACKRRARLTHFSMEVVYLSFLEVC
jgi:hypothetical protein